MLHSLKIVQFKGIWEKKISFENGINLIIGDNGVGKTNILESIGILFWENLFPHPLWDYVKQGENMFYIEWSFEQNTLPQSLSISYTKDDNKKHILLNGKKASKKDILSTSLRVSFFLPLSMNLFYLWPKYRRDFLDQALINAFEGFGEILKHYEKVVKNRNKILKNIFEKKSHPDELTFWDDELIKYAIQIYKKRLQYRDYINGEICKYTDIFWWKIQNISLQYLSKTDLSDIAGSMKKYLEINKERDIILGKTNIWPHLDDFDIHLNNMSIESYASRGETKTIIMSLKLLELTYIEKITWKKALFLIDDFMSELDKKHRDIFLEKLSWHQVIVTNIVDIPELVAHKILLF